MSSSISSLIDAVRRALGWCPEVPEPTGFQKLARLPYVYFSALNARPVQVGLTVALIIQFVESAVGTVYVLPGFLNIVEKIAESEGSLPPEESLGALFYFMLFAVALLSMSLLSSGFVGFTVGKVSSSLRYGVAMGIVSILLGQIVSRIISLLYAPSFYEIQQTLFNLDFASERSIADTIVGWIRTYLFLFALGGGGGAIGQVLGLKFGGKEKK